MVAPWRRMRQRIEESEESDPYDLAILYAGLGENDLALSALEDGFTIRSPNMIYLRIEPFFDSLRSDPRYRRLQEKTGLD